MPNPGKTVPKDALILLSAGRDEGVYVAGLHRATADLDLDSLAQRYLAGIASTGRGFSPPELPPVAFGVDPGIADPVERGFILWLVGAGLLERMPTVEVWLDGGFGDDGPMLKAGIHDPDGVMRDPAPGIQVR